MATFTVDTQLFRELGELLVGRDSTALTELVKNSYDADATVVQVIGQRLRDGGEGTITVIDNGTGMTGEEFRTGYLTIAGRSKEQGDRRSGRYGRRFTGEKGIGRLAAHKLAHELRVNSVAAGKRTMRGRRQVRARINWDAVEKYDTIADIGPDALRVSRRTLDKLAPAGTAIVLETLRHAWSDAEIADFVVEMAAFEPPALLRHRLHKAIAPEPLLFEQPVVRDVRRSDQFGLELEGDFEQSEDLWRQVADTANWVMEIESSPRSVCVAIAPTRSTSDQVPSTDLMHFEIPPPAGSSQPSFSTRILTREQVRGTRRTRDFASQVAGIRVYMEGFRVAPYGDRSNDWLNIDRDYGRRTARLHLDFPGLPTAPPGIREELTGLPNRAYVGAVFLTHEGAPSLEMLVNREGFLPSVQLDAVRNTVRTGIDLLTRIRAHHRVMEPASMQAGDSGRPPQFLSDELVVREGVQAATEHARALRTTVTQIARGSDDAADRADELVQELEELTAVAERAAADRSLVRVLASVGTQMAAFVHETQGLVGGAYSVVRSLELLAEDDEEHRSDLLDLRQTVADLARRIDVQASYLSDTATLAARRRRQRLQVAERFDAAASLLEAVADRRGVEIANKIPGDLRTAPMYSSELTVLFGNLLTNAVKAAGENGRVRIRGRRTKQGLALKIENTGAAVDPREGEQWFRPFASTTADTIDPVLGQGMGLGLPITRSIVEDYRGTVTFVTPSQDFTSALEVRLP